jgi:hypothetical protein
MQRYNGSTPLTHKLDRRAREHPHAKITPTGGIFGCSNLIFGAGSKGTMLGTACMHSLEIITSAGPLECFLLLNLLSPRL